MNMDYSKEIRSYFEKEKRTLDAISIEDVSLVMNVLEKARIEGRKVFIMGNGGSAATASHFCCDFNKGISEHQENKYKFICLNDNVPTMMAYANDRTYHDIFVEPLKNLLDAGDLVIGISGSGNSMNVVNALRYANENGAITVGLTGYDGGNVKKICKYNIHIPIDDMQVTEDLHMVLDHCMMKILSNNN